MSAGRLSFFICLTLLQQSLGALQRHGFLRKTKRHRAKSHSMKALYPFYHGTDDIHDDLLSLATRCPGMTVESKTGSSGDGGSRSIDVVTIKAPGASPVNKNFLLFGEHARELISPESGLHFIKSLCGETGLKDKAAEVLKDSEFQIVVNGNPESRKKVEQGDFCLRVNPDGVDLNRNWDEEWQGAAILDPADTNPGPKPFSEPETKIFKELVTAYKPTNFLTVHSGTKGMYMPWAYDMQHLATRNQPAMMQILKDLDSEHCQCPFGAAGKEVGYSCPGTCLDWVYDKLQTKYAFAFEIYANPLMDFMLKDRWAKKMKTGGLGAFYQTHSHLGHRHFHDVFEKCPSDFVQLHSESHGQNLDGMSPTECFGNFNPGSKDEFESVLNNWSAAYLEMAAMIVKDMRQGIVTNSTPTTPL